MFVEWSYQDKKFRRAKHVALEGSVVTADTKIRSTISLVYIKWYMLIRCSYRVWNLCGSNLQHYRNAISNKSYIVAETTELITKKPFWRRVTKSRILKKASNLAIFNNMRLDDDYFTLYL